MSIYGKHTKGDSKCKECCCGGPEPCHCGGLMHSYPVDCFATADGDDVWTHNYKCDKCGAEVNVEEPNVIEFKEESHD